MATELLDEHSVSAYLTRRGIISGTAQVEVLIGGVSNVVLAISTQREELVLKQSLPELKVATKWAVDQRRAIVEARAMKLMHSITPKCVPELIDVDPIQFTLTMKRLPLTATNWKADLLAGRIHPSIGSELGEILAIWHNYGAENESARKEFLEDSLFEQLRVTPFYREVARLNLDLASKINLLIEEITTQKITLVHGDFSPKNVMISSQNYPSVLDFEVEHAGNPVFDLAFLSAHLLCKYLSTTNQAEQLLLRETALNFLTSYSSSSILSISATLPQHVAVIARARVEGVSPVNYLDEAAKRRVLDLTQAALHNSAMTIEQLFSEKLI